ncbi:MAG: hypothetical protein RL481_875, partial [Pseudomonadota bacterium]
MTRMIALSLDPIFDEADLDGAAEKFRAELTETSSQLRHIPIPLLGEKLADAIFDAVGD